jgi:hypothetical protein
VDEWAHVTEATLSDRAQWLLREQKRAERKKGKAPKRRRTSRDAQWQEEGGEEGGGGKPKAAAPTQVSNRVCVYMRARLCMRGLLMACLKNQRAYQLAHISMHEHRTTGDLRSAGIGRRRVHLHPAPRAAGMCVCMCVCVREREMCVWWFMWALLAVMALTPGSHACTHELTLVLMRVQHCIAYPSSPPTTHEADG